MDILAAECEIQSLKSQIRSQEITILSLTKEVELKNKIIQQLKEEIDKKIEFGIKKVLAKQNKVKNLFKVLYWYHLYKVYSIACIPCTKKLPARL